jgi:prefoldin subunit 5
MTDKENVVIIDEVEYKVDDMGHVDQYTVMQIRDVRDQIQKLNFRMAQLQASQSTFMTTLAKSLKETNSDTDQNNA